METRAYGQLCHQLISTAELPALGPGTPNRAAYDALRSLDAKSIGGDRAVLDGKMADCCLSGLWLLHNYLDESHKISQDIHSSTGSFWHGIMHRREPDYSNAKYWFRRAGEHPVLNAVGSAVWEEYPDFCSEGKSDGVWEPYAFVDACERAIGDDAQAMTCRSVARLEWAAMFEYCYVAAYGK